MRSASVIFTSCTEAITYLPSPSIHSCEERMGAQRGTNHDASTVAAVVGKKAHLGMKWH